jgi:hypothetical protein
MTTNYARGRAFEYRVRDIFIGLDYLVLRSAGSHTPIDLIAIDVHRKVLFIQCQRGRWFAKAKLAELRKVANRVHATAVIACRSKQRGKVDFYELKGNRKMIFSP